MTDDVLIRRARDESAAAESSHGVGWDARPQADEIRRRERVASLLARQPDRALPGRVADFLSLAAHRPTAGEFFGGMLRILPPSFVVGINGLRAWARTKAGIKG